MSGVLKITNEGVVWIKELPKLVLYPNECLKQIAPEFDFSTNDAVAIANALIEIMKKEDGIGLSACQVGWNHRVFVMGKDDQIVAFFNPKILNTSSEKVKMQEGCLSFPGLLLKIERPSFIEVEWQDFNGEKRHAHYGGITARVFQHEYDHINGICFTDHVGSTSLMLAKERQKKLIKKMERIRVS